MNKIQKGLLERNIIAIDKEINEALARYVHEAFLYLRAKDSPDITILFTSEGGSMDIGLDIFDTIRLYKGAKAGIVIGYVYSMATIVLQACSVRMCAKHARIHVHNVGVCMDRMALEYFEDGRTMKALKKDLRDLQAIINKILIEKTGQSEDVINEQLKREEKLSAEEALAFGLIDGII